VLALSSQWWNLMKGVAANIHEEMMIMGVLPQLRFVNALFICCFNGKTAHFVF
jgi:hypothetical protein